jgi:hypothetical protein
MGQRGMHIGYWWESQKERHHLEDKDIGGWIILSYVRVTLDGVLDWILYLMATYTNN